MKRGNFLLGIAVAVFIISVLSLFQIMNGNMGLVVGDIGIVMLALLVVIIGILGYRLIEKKFVSERRFWIFLVIAFMLRLLGELVRAVYEIGLNKTFHTSISVEIILWLSYFFVLIAFGYKLKHTYIEKKNFVIYKMLAICTALAIGYIYFSYTDIIANQVSNMMLSFMNAMYVVFDIYVIGLILAINLPSIKNYTKVMKSSFVMAFAFMSFGFYDYFLAIGIRRGWYLSGAFIDTFYYLAYFLVIYSVYLRYNIMENYDTKISKILENYKDKKPVIVKKDKCGFLISAGVIIFILGVANLFLVKGNVRLIADNLFRITLIAILSVMLILCYNSIDKKFKKERKSWFFFSSAAIFMLLGSLIWAYYEVILKIGVPILSVIDIVWTLSYLSAIIGLAYKIKQTYYENKTKIVSTIMILCTIAAAIYAYNKIDSAFSSLNVFFVILDIYIVGLLLLLTVPLIFEYNKTIKSYILIVFAFFIMVIVDILVSADFKRGMYVSGMAANLLFYFSLIVLIYGIYIKYKTLNSYKVERSNLKMKKIRGKK